MTGVHSKFVLHSTEIIRQSKIKGPLFSSWHSSLRLYFSASKTGVFHSSLVPFYVSLAMEESTKLQPLVGFY
jgi:hypothetical protein